MPTSRKQISRRPTSEKHISKKPTSGKRILRRPNSEKPISEKPLSAARRDCPDFGGSCRFGKGRVFIGDPVKSMPQPSAERAVIDCATDLEQQIGAPLRPSHLLRFVHAPVDQEVRCAFGNRRSNPLTGTVSFGIVDQPRGLASEIFIDRMQRVPQLARRCALRAPAALALEDMYDLADPLDAALSILRLAIPNRQCRRSTSATI